MPDDLNRKRSAQWRELICLSLRAELGPSHPIAVRPVVRKLSEALADDWPTGRGDILGIPGWTLNTSAAHKLDLFASLDELESARAADGNRFGAVVQYRRGRPTHEAYTVMTFATLAEILKESA